MRSWYVIIFDPITIDPITKKYTKYNKPAHRPTQLASARPIVARNWNCSKLRNLLNHAAQAQR
jgi:hypothetical protein